MTQASQASRFSEKYPLHWQQTSATDQAVTLGSSILSKTSDFFESFKQIIFGSFASNEVIKSTKEVDNPEELKSLASSIDPWRRSGTVRISSNQDEQLVGCVTAMHLRKFEIFCITVASPEQAQNALQLLSR